MNIIYFCQSFECFNKLYSLGFLSEGQMHQGISSIQRHLHYYPEILNSIQLA